MNNLAGPGGIPAGFSSPVHDAQATFRVLLEAMSRPGKRLSVPVQPEVFHGFPDAALSVLLSLADFDTPIWLSDDHRKAVLREFLTFHCGCPVVEQPSEAVFGLVHADINPEMLGKFNPGLPEYPDRSATIVVVAESLETGNGSMIQGPGVRDQAVIRVAGTLPGFWKYVAANSAMFPQGVDFIFVGDGEMVCLPRSVMVREVLCT
ncbi:MAG: phosphonate C-P lyase system protein PhnH [Desulfovibrionales bacterium]|nr:MAG: phosphonate C-P lyase system protein PhnH [Desulfovibrionales bacterium]